MFTKEEFRKNPELTGKAKLLLTIAVCFLAGAIVSGFIYMHVGFKIFYLISVCLLVVILYDVYKVRVMRYFKATRPQPQPSPDGLLTKVRKLEQPETAGKVAVY